MIFGSERKLAHMCLAEAALYAVDKQNGREWNEIAAVQYIFSSQAVDVDGYITDWRTFLSGYDPFVQELKWLIPGVDIIKPEELYLIKLNDHWVVAVGLQDNKLKIIFDPWYHSSVWEKFGENSVDFSMVQDARLIVRR